MIPCYRQIPLLQDTRWSFFTRVPFPSFLLSIPSPPRPVADQIRYIIRESCVLRGRISLRGRSADRPGLLLSHLFSIVCLILTRIFCVQVWEIIGRSCVVHEGTPMEGRRLAASVVARSSAVGGNHKMVCSCDGTKLWDAGDIA